jgi:hypothetical protein
MKTRLEVWIDAIKLFKFYRNKLECLSLIIFM